MYAALSCSNLQQLDVTVAFDQDEAEMLLQLAPVGLQSLYLHTDLDVLTCMGPPASPVQTALLQNALIPSTS